MPEKEATTFARKLMTFIQDGGLAFDDPEWEEDAEERLTEFLEKELWQYESIRTLCEGPIQQQVEKAKKEKETADA